MERGATLSAGQRQLLSFARAVAFDPPLLVLDEATASIDTENEEIIQESLKKISKNRTTVIIAHRLSTIKNADNIIVIHQGEIAETGNHEELLRKDGVYKKLYDIQFL
jgi:ABC-type multidrug transport system fused ATPase/permease subunit